MWRKVVAGTALLASFLAVGADKSVEAAGIKLKIQGQSGKMTMTVPTDAGGTQDVVVEMSALRQLDASGITLGSGGSKKHSFNSFATQEFTIGEPVEDTYEGLGITKITFESTMVETSKITVHTMIFQESGTFTVAGETLSVTNGTIKFNVELESWVWCGDSGISCTSKDGTGDAVELDLSIKVKGGNNPSKKGSTEATGTFELGGGSELVMISNYTVVEEGGAMKDVGMDEGYPKVDGASFTLKFSRWTGNKVIYDPLVMSSGTKTPPDNNIPVSSAAQFSFGLVSVCSALTWLM